MKNYYINNNTGKVFLLTEEEYKKMLDTFGGVYTNYGQNIPNKNIIKKELSSFYDSITYMSNMQHTVSEVGPLEAWYFTMNFKHKDFI